MRFNKKGLEAEVLIGIIITVLVAAVIFFFLRGLTFKGIIDREACHQSVLLRSMPSIIGDAMKRSIPLKCKTEDILISFEDEELIKQRIATAMHDCWWMLGEGKLDFFTESTLQNFGLTTARTSCIICSTIDFSNRVKKIKNLDLISYLKETKIPLKDKTYIEYFAGIEDKELPTSIDVAPIDTGQKYSIVYMHVEGTDFWEPIANDLKVAGATLLTGSFFFGGKTAFGSFFKLFKVGTETIRGSGFAFPEAIPTRTVLVGLGKFVIPAVLIFIAGQEVMTAINQNIVAGYCDGNKEGCNAVVLAPLTKEQIAKTCKNIESIP